MLNTLAYEIKHSSNICLKARYDHRKQGEKYVQYDRMKIKSKVNKNKYIFEFY